MNSAQRAVILPEAATLSPQRAYQLWASHYDSSVNPLLVLEERRLACHLATFGGKDVVDLGCGTGRWLRKLETLRPKSLTGVDFSHEMLDQARPKCAPTTKLLEADCINSPLHSGAADRILASFLLSYLLDLPAFARESARILRNKGSILISDLHFNTASYGWRRTFRAGGAVFEIETQRYTLTYLVGVMQHAGFRLGYLADWPFGTPEAQIFERAGKWDTYLKVQSLPVVYCAQFTLAGGHI
jgi:ubiquinone/menaquinone biosynthesis C-methylase UbiE